MLPNHRLFIERYVECWNLADAYIDIYGDEMTRSSASSSAHDLLKIPENKTYFESLIEQRSKEIHVDALFAVKKLIEVVHSDYVSGVVEMTKDEMDGMDKDLKRLVQSIKIKRKYYKDQDLTETTYAVKFMSKDKALKSLGKHLGLEVDRLELSGSVGVRTFAESVSDIYDDIEKEENQNQKAFLQ